MWCASGPMQNASLAWVGTRVVSTGYVELKHLVLPIQVHTDKSYTAYMLCISAGLMSAGLLKLSLGMADPGGILRILYRSPASDEAQMLVNCETVGKSRSTASA